MSIRLGEVHDEHWLAVMAALDNMMGKTGHNHPGLSWHTSLLLNHRIRSLGRQLLLNKVRRKLMVT